MTKRLNTASKREAPFAVPGNEALLTVSEVGRLLHCSKSALDKWRISGDGPRFVRIGALIRYRPADIAAYIAARTCV
jgi:predicted DNA-binding transcriptional regulator AlpA